MSAAIIAFTAQGAALALRVAECLSGEAWTPPAYCLPGMRPLEESVGDWTGQRFSSCDTLVFVGACGIAVRAIAPHVRSKTTDPAVLVMDEHGRHVIPLLSGHIGGANAMASLLAERFGAATVITTATDLNGVTAVDDWAVRHDCAIENPGVIKAVSASALAGHSVGVAVTEQLLQPPFPVTLWLRPRTLVLGTGCRKGVALPVFEEAVADFLGGAGVSALSLRAVASLDRKAREPALLAFCESRALPFLTYTARELAEVPGRFTVSERVLRETGVDNVCERAAVKATESGVLLRSKTVYPGITLALAKGGEQDANPHGGH